MKLAWLAILLLVAQAPGQEHSESKLGNPFTTPRDRDDGGSTYRSQCASCHGIDARGGAQGPNLASGQYKHAVSDEAMYRVITKGVPGTSMPAFALNGKETWQVVTYLRSLNERAAKAGDPQRGRDLAAKSGCMKCHATGAPDLGDAARVLTRAELRQAILEPGAKVDPRYWPWSGTVNGETVQGYRLNEDSFSIQIIDRKGQLRTFAKPVSAAKLEKRSPMPTFQGKLSDSELNDVIAYLETLQ